MARDAIVEEVRAIRQAIADEHGNDLEAIIEAFRRQDAANGVQTVSFPPKRLTEKGNTRRAG
jgi:hypothetical protein